MGEAFFIVKQIFYRVSFISKEEMKRGVLYMFFKRIETEGLSHYSYIVGDGPDLAVIDPRRDIGIYMREARKAGRRIKHIFETHRNEDLITGSMELQEKTGGKIYRSAYEDLGYVYGEEIKDGFEVKLGGIIIKALHTPGHTLGHMSYALYEKGKENAYLVFTGDSLFMGDVGRTDFYGKENLEKMTGLMYESIFEKLMPLGEDVIILPAHGPGSACGISMDDRPYSTLGYERKYNPVLQVNSKEEFIKNFAQMRIKPQYFERMEVLNVKGAPFVGEEVLLNALTVDEIEEMKDEILILDVRTKEGYFGGHIPGSIFMSKNNISTFLGAIFSFEKKVVFAIDGDYGDVEDLYWYCKRIGFDNIAGYLPSACKKWERHGFELEQFATITAIDFIELPKDGDYILIDIRKSEELEEGDPSSNRINLPLQQISQCFKIINKDKDIYILCGSGERATIGASYLKTKGYESKVITGGIKMLAAIE